MMVGESQPASENMLGSPGTPGPVILLMSSAMPAKVPMVLLPKPESRPLRKAWSGGGQAQEGAAKRGGVVE